MRGVHRETVTMVWLGLVLATCVSWFLGADHGSGNQDLVTTALLIVAFIKVRFVGMYFMELKGAPTPLRLVFEGYTVVVCAALLGLCVLA